MTDGLDSQNAKPDLSLEPTILSRFIFPFSSYDDKDDNLNDDDYDGDDDKDDNEDHDGDDDEDTFII